MKRRSLKEKLLSVLAVAVMFICFSQAVFAKPSPSEINKALNIKDLFIFDSDEEKVGIELKYDGKLETKLEYFFNQYPSAKLHKIFGVKGYVDSEDGTRITVRDSSLAKKFAVFQYDVEKESWKKLTSGKGSTKVSFTVKSKEPIIITDNAPKVFKQKVLKLNYKTKELEPGQKFQIEVTDADNDYWKNVAKKTFKSSNTSVATVDKNGVVTAKNKSGSASISVKVGSKTVSCKVKVSRKVTSVSLKPKTLNLSYNKSNKSATLKATVLPSNATNKKLKWTSSNKKVATVSSTGKVTVKKKAAKGATATITATAKDGSGKKATCKVRVV